MIFSRIRRSSIPAFLTAAWALPGCLAELEEPTRPYAPPHNAQYSQTILGPTSGVYTVHDGSDLLGEEVVGQWVGATFCLYSAKDAVFLELKGGMRNDSLHFTGVLRQIRSGRSYVVNSLSSPWSNSSRHSVRLVGKYGGKYALDLEWNRPAADQSLTYIVAHRGGGRNSDRLGRSENSLEMLRYAEVLGANAVEIDVRRSSDFQLILFHDETFSPRTMQGGYLLGPVRNFSLWQIQTYGRLINGEKVPTLREALWMIIRETQIKLVWLDIKEPEIVCDVLKEQDTAMIEARRLGSRTIVVLGIPDTDVLDAYRDCGKCNYDRKWPVLWEDAIDSISSIENCKFWGPKWTSKDAENIGSVRNDICALPWTIDVPVHMRDWIEKLSGKANAGIVTNYPCLLHAMVRRGK